MVDLMSYATGFAQPDSSAPFASIKALTTITENTEFVSVPSVISVVGRRVGRLSVLVVAGLERHAPRAEGEQPGRDHEQQRGAQRQRPMHADEGAADADGEAGEGAQAMREHLVDADDASAQRRRRVELDQGLRRRA